MTIQMSDEIDKVKRSIKRAGNNFLIDIFSNHPIIEQKLSGKDALEIMNTLGQPLHIIILIANSHGLDVDEEEFNKLREEQKQRCKNARQC